MRWHRLPAGGRLVAQLLRGAGEDGAGKHRVVAPHAFVDRGGGCGGECADAQAAVVGVLDGVHRQAVDVDQRAGRFDLELHQVEQVGAAGDGLYACIGGQLCRVLEPLGALVVERPHAGSSCNALWPAMTSRMAARMLA